MNVFILSTGRCGSVTFSKACKYISNYSSGHEERSRLLGNDRIDFPKNHIEIDSRLCWFLGRLEKKYGDDAFYVHLKRDRKKVAESYDKRWFKITGIMDAYTRGIVMSEDRNLKYCYDYVDTVNENIEAFLKNKSKKTIINIENIQEDFKTFWTMIEAEGDLEQALASFEIKHNATTTKSQLKTKYAKHSHKLVRAFKAFPLFLKNV